MNQAIERLLLYLVAATTGLLLGSSYFLPMTDLPQHAGQVEILTAMLTGNGDEPRFDNLTLNYLTPYWIAYLAATAFSLFLPVNYAINIVVALAFWLFLWSFSSLRKRFGGPRILDWILLPCFFGFPYVWGFLTFLLAIPLGVILLDQNLKFLESRRNPHWLGIMVSGIALYFSHLLVFLFFCQIAVGMTLVDNKHSLIEKGKKILPFCILSTLLVVVFLNGDFFREDGLMAHFHSVTYRTYEYGPFPLRVLSLPVFPWGYSGNSDFLAYEQISFVLLALPVLSGYRFTRDLKRYVPLLSFIIVWFLLPSHAGRTAFIYHRFSIFLFPFYILIFDPADTIRKNFIERSLQTLGPFLWVLLSLWLLKFIVDDLNRFKQETQEFRVLLDKMPAGKKAVSVVYDKNDDGNRNATAMTYAHFPVWYQALKHGWVDFNFAWYPPQVVRYKTEATPESLPHHSEKPTQFLSFKNCDYYELMFVRTGEKVQIEEHERMLRQSTCSHKLAYRSGRWSVYRR